MKTYNQQKNGGSFDWNQFLDRAIAGQVSSAEKGAATKKSRRWTTCACGNQCAVLERESDGEPLDTKLSNLGLDFMDNIVDQNYKLAKKTLKKIEARSSKLIFEEVKKHAKILANLGYRVVPIGPALPQKQVA